MSPPVSFTELRWRALIDQAIAHGESPGRATGALLQARRNVKGVPVPVLEEVKLFTALAWLCEAFAEGDVGRRRSLGHYLVGLATYCQDAMAPPPPPAAAAGGEQPFWLRD